MKIIDLNNEQNNNRSSKIVKHYSQLEKLIFDLNERGIPGEIIQVINDEINLINSYKGTKKDFLSQVKKSKSNILKLIEKELKLVPKFHYQNLWMAYGMMAGLMISLVLKQFGLDNTWNSVGMLLPMGMLFGIVVGKKRDEKAKNDEQQLNI
jgi:hypothetical protein